MATPDPLTAELLQLNQRLLDSIAAGDWSEETQSKLKEAVANFAEEFGYDAVWLYDHFHTIPTPTQEVTFECWTSTAAIARDTKRVRIGQMVTCNSYRNPDLLADMARTVDHISGGRTILGLGAGWSERDYREYGCEFGGAAERRRALEATLKRIRARLEKLDPRPLGARPIMLGGGGEKVTLRLVAQYAEMWNSVGNDVALFRRRQEVLNRWCERCGRDPAQVERTVCYEPERVSDPSRFIESGARHLIAQWRHPFDPKTLGQARSRAGR